MILRGGDTVKKAVYVSVWITQISVDVQAQRDSSANPKAEILYRLISSE